MAVGGTLGEDSGDFGFGEGEAGAGGGEGCGELRVVFAEVLGGDEEVVVAGALPPLGALCFGAAIAVPQSVPQTARASIIFCIVLFIVVFLSSFAQAHSRACKK